MMSLIKVLHVACSNVVCNYCVCCVLGGTNNAKFVDHSIKLGLGDFVFYSVLVSRAATYGFTTFMSCYLVILGGLGMTLVLLAVFRKALPALPISIFLGIAFYLCTRFFIVPFVEASGSIPIYM
mmetsp:Transcript_12165/g.18374  ORF Transcript_12165/g.18374 Transcript_12165/m.18374 type:complete len:124 (-) Transcript_12165:140-511(-)